jgi:hypothetical protein
MEILLLALVIIGALFVIASGIWVAFALAKVISVRQAQGMPAHQSMPDSESEVPAEN